MLKLLCHYKHKPERDAIMNSLDHDSINIAPENMITQECKTTSQQQAQVHNYTPETIKKILYQKVTYL